VLFRFCQQQGLNPPPALMCPAYNGPAQRDTTWDSQMLQNKGEAGGRVPGAAPTRPYAANHLSASAFVAAGAVGWHAAWLLLLFALTARRTLGMMPLTIATAQPTMCLI
jgi:hypothetical protein